MVSPNCNYALLPGFLKIMFYENLELNKNNDFQPFYFYKCLNRILKNKI